MLKFVLVGTMIASAVLGSVHAESADLAWGVFITHYVPELGYSSDPPPAGWCEAYWSHALLACENQVNRIDVSGYVGCTWFVLAAWEEEKEWCGVEFGLGAFDARVFGFADHGPCFPQTGVELPTAGWPGPNEGTALATEGVPWLGNYMPVYYFGGYAYSYYGPGTIPLDVNPETGFAGTVNCLHPPHSWEAIEMGSVGINTDGVLVCPEGMRSACCDPVTYECTMLSQEDCDALGGHWAPLPYQCPQACHIRVCCLYGACLLLSAPECFNIGGDRFSIWDSCDPNPCGGPSPHSKASWGQIKALYR